MRTVAVRSARIAAHDLCACGHEASQHFTSPTATWNGIRCHGIIAGKAHISNLCGCKRFAPMLRSSRLYMVGLTVAVAMMSPLIVVLLAVRGAEWLLASAARLVFSAVGPVVTRWWLAVKGGR